MFTPYTRQGSNFRFNSISFRFQDSAKYNETSRRRHHGQARAWRRENKGTSEGN